MATRPDDSGSDGPPTDSTGVVPEVQLRLADFVDGEPPLPVALLVVVTGPARGETLVVDELPAVIGRSSDADVVLADDTVSRRHVRLSGDRDAIEIEDLGSSNGTTLHGNPIAGALVLRDGDLVGLGSATVLVKLVH